jgi:antitoxin component of MazEF toxin-antitoxin module
MEEIIMAKKRSIKVYGQSGYKYQETPTIMLKGMWLKELGFDIGDYISVTCEDGRLVITPDAERAAVEAAEAEFMERETKALQKRYEAEKVKIRAQMVAEPGARW